MHLSELHKRKIMLNKPLNTTEWNWMENALHWVQSLKHSISAGDKFKGKSLSHFKKVKKEKKQQKQTNTCSGTIFRFLKESYRKKGLFKLR